MNKTGYILILFTALIFFQGCSNSNNNKFTLDENIDSIISLDDSPVQKDIQQKQWKKELLSQGLKQIIDNNKLTVAMLQDDKEVFLETQENGKLTGIDVDLAKDIANSLGVELIIDRSCNTYDELTEFLINGNADLIISTYSLSTDRAAYINLSKPYLTSRLGVMLNKQELVKNNIEKNPLDYMRSNNIKMAALKNSSHVNSISEIFPNAEIIQMDSYLELCQAVRNNDVFGCLCGEIEFLFQYESNPELDIYTKVFVFSDALEKYCIGVSPNNLDLLKFVNTYIESSNILTINDVEEKIPHK